ncbi:MAG: riboflavin synthase, partial [Frankia sp.]
MFTGIVEEIGEVEAIEVLPAAARMSIGCRTVLDDVTLGASIAVNGVCLTVTDFVARGDQPGFRMDVMQETLDRSSLGTLRPGDPVNLERPVRLADRLGGHLVQGHVDGVGTVLERIPDEHWEIVRISLPAGLDRYVVEKGSITVDGVSLTVVAVEAAAEGPGTTATFTVSLIPTTLHATTLGTRAVGEPVNLEVDVVAKYVEKLTVAQSVPPAGGALPGPAVVHSPAA